MVRGQKESVYISDTAYQGLIQLAYERGYVRGAGPEDRPRGLSKFIAMAALRTYNDARPDYLQGTGQWHTGLEPCKERTIHATPGTLAAIGNIALQHQVWPYKTQAPVVNGFRREATVPVLHPAHDAPAGATSIKALVGPVLEAIGLGWLKPVEAYAHAPHDLYATPSRRVRTRERLRAQALSDSL